MTREWVEWYRNEHIKPHVTYNDEYPSMTAARDHIVEQMDSQGLHWPGFQRVKKRKIQDRLCFGLAVEAQHQGDFEVVEQEDASTDTANPDQLTTTQPRRHTPIPSAAQTTLPSLAQRAQNATIDPALLLLSNHSNQNSEINDLLARLAQLVTAVPNANQAISMPSNSSNEHNTADHESNDQEEHAIQRRVRFNLPAYKPPETSQGCCGIIATASPYTVRRPTAVRKRVVHLDLGDVTLKMHSVDRSVETPGLWRMVVGNCNYYTVASKTTRAELRRITSLPRLPPCMYLLCCFIGHIHRG
jgi:hypothetical protein